MKLSVNTVKYFVSTKHFRLAVINSVSAGSLIMAQYIMEIHLTCIDLQKHTTLAPTDKLWEAVPLATMPEKIVYLFSKFCEGSAVKNSNSDVNS